MTVPDRTDDDLLSDVLDGLADDEDVDRVRNDPVLSTRLADLRAVRAGLGPSPDDDLGAGADARIAAAITAGRTRTDAPVVDVPDTAPVPLPRRRAGAPVWVAVAAALVLIIAGASLLAVRQGGGDTTAADSADLSATTTVTNGSEVPAMAPSSDQAESATAGQGPDDLGSFGTAAELRDQLGPAFGDRSSPESPGPTSAPVASDRVSDADRACQVQLGALGAEWIGTATVAGRPVVVGRNDDGTWVVLEPPSCTRLP